MNLEAQLAELASCGLTLDPGITIDDVLYSFDRAAYENKPFDLLLFVFGAEVEREPWGRPFSSRVWNFDTECVSGKGSYVKIVKRLARVAGTPERLSDVRDAVDLDIGEAWLEYTVDGQQRHWDIEVNDDWADMMVVSYVMADLEAGGRRFYSKDNGQAMVLYYLDEAAAARLNRLSKNALKPVLAV